MCSVTVCCVAVLLCCCVAVCCVAVLLCCVLCAAARGAKFSCGVDLVCVVCSCALCVYVYGDHISVLKASRFLNQVSFGDYHAHE